jgi:PAS domain S-box-containing protein
MSRRAKRLVRVSPIKVVIPYVAVSTLYLLSSDYILQKLVPNVDELIYFQTVKGIFFILATALLIYLWVKRITSGIQDSYENAMELRKKAEEQIRESEEKYWTLFNTSPIPMWIFEIKTLRFLLVNEAAVNQYGYSRQEFAKMTLEDIRPKEDIIDLYNSVPAFGRLKQKSRHQFRHLTKEGHLIHVRIDSSDVMYEGVKARLVLATNLTNEIQFRNELDVSNTRLKAAGQTAKLGYWTHDLTNGCITWSDEMFDIFERNREDFQVNIENLTNAFHPDHRGQLKTISPKKIPGRNYVEEEHKILAPDGRVKWILERIIPTNNDEGVPIRLDGIVLDITDRKKAEEAIALSNERFLKLSQVTTEAMIDWDIANKRVFWGEGFEKLFGYRPEENDLDFWQSHIHPEDAQRVKGSVRSAFFDRSSSVFLSEYRFVKADGSSAYVRHRGVVVRNEQGRVVRTVNAISDITDETAYLRQIEEQNQRLKEIAWIQSHVVRAPLATLKGLTNLLESQKTGNTEHDQLLSFIKDAADKLDVVINEVVQKAEILQSLESDKVANLQK